MRDRVDVAEEFVKRFAAFWSDPSHVTADRGAYGRPGRVAGRYAAGCGSCT
jgi:hypothetical protein